MIHTDPAQYEANTPISQRKGIIRAMPPKEFQERIAPHGLKAYYESGSKRSKTTWYYTFTISGIKAEIKSNSYSVGFHNDQELDWRKIQDELNPHFELRNEPNYNSTETILIYKFHVAPNSGKWQEVLDDFEKLIKLLEEIQDIDTKVGERESKYGIDFDKENAFQSMAEFIDFAMKKKIPDTLDRIGSLADALYDRIILGSVSKDLGKKEAWKEHVVPCAFIIREALKRLKDGEETEKIRELIEENLFIVVITRKQQKEIDKTMRTTMPDNWKIGSDPLARLLTLEGFRITDFDPEGEGYQRYRLLAEKNGWLGLNSFQAP